MIWEVKCSRLILMNAKRRAQSLEVESGQWEWELDAVQTKYSLQQDKAACLGKVWLGCRAGRWLPEKTGAEA